MGLNLLLGNNVFSNIPKEVLIKQAGKISLKDKDYAFAYSNYGMSLVGAVVSELYGRDYRSLVNEYLSSDLGLQHTMVAEGTGDLKVYWKWQPDDGYLPAGALISTIGDMLQLAQLQMSETLEHIAETHKPLTDIKAISSGIENIRVGIDSVGAAWMIDSLNGIIWHNGGTTNYNCYLGFDKQRQIAVVVLTNLPPSFRISATVLGAKILTDLQKKQID